MHLLLQVRRVVVQSCINMTLRDVIFISSNGHFELTEVKPN